MLLPLLQHKRYDAPSAFTPESLLREARRQKGLEVAAVPAVCVLDPDGEAKVSLLAARSLACWSGGALCFRTGQVRRHPRP